MSSSSRRLNPLWVLAGILLLATNLRAPFTAVSPLLDTLGAAFGMGSSEAGVLITVPLLTFCVVSPFAARLAQRLGLERALFLAVLVMGGGIVVRSLGPQWCLFLGTAVLGAGIAIGNTLLPSLLKRDFPKDITKWTAVYSVTMGVAAALGSAAVVPLAHATNWQISLAAFLVLPVLSALLWLPQLGRHTLPSVNATSTRRNSLLWRTPLAWQVALFFGVNSFVYYAVAAWLPSILVSAGYSPAEAGSLHGIMQLGTAVPGLLIVPLVQRARDQRGLAVGLAGAGIVALLGLLLAPGLAIAWVTIFGFGIGGAFVLALAFIGLRSTTPLQAAGLSGMTQCVGYLLSATGPVLAGMGHDAAGSWQPVLIVCIVLCGALAVLGMGAGRAIHLPEN